MRYTGAPSGHWICLLTLSLLSACGGGGGGSPADNSSGGGTTPTPIASLSVDTSSVMPGDSVTLTWSSQNATTCTVSGGWTGSKPTSGSEVVGPLNQSTSFSLTCANGAQNAVTSVNVTVAWPSLPYTAQVSYDDVNDVVWDAQRGVLYLAIGSAGVTHANSILALDPILGVIRASVFGGSEPTSLAMSEDGQFLYVGLRGSDSVRRYALPQLALDEVIQTDTDQLSAVSDEGGVALFADQIAVLPGSPKTIAIGRSSALGLTMPYGYMTTSNFPGAAAVIDDNTMRQYPVANVSNGTTAAWGADSNTLYVGMFESTTRWLVSVDSVTNAGVTFSGTAGTLPGSDPNGLVFSGGLLYDNSGSVLDPATSQVSAPYAHARGPAAIDPASDRIYYARQDPDTYHLQVFAYGLTDRELKAVADLTVGEQARHIVRWGVDGLAISTNWGRLIVVAGALVASGGSQSPVGVIPGTTADPIAGITLNSPASVSPVALPLEAVDLVWDATHGLLYAAIPDGAADHPRSIAVIDPGTGAVQSYVSVATSPSALAVSDDGQYLYVGEEMSFERFQLPAFAHDLTVDTSSTIASATNMEVAPGLPHTVAIGVATKQIGGSNVSAVYDDGNLRGMGMWGGLVSWGSDASTLYGFSSFYDSSQNAELYTFNVTPAGLTQTQLIHGDRFVTTNLPLSGMGFHRSGGLFYADTGAIYDPVTQHIVGTLPLGHAVGADSGLGSIAIDPIKGRAYALANSFFIGTLGGGANYFMVFDLATQQPLLASVVQAARHTISTRLFKTGDVTFASLDTSGQVLLFDDPVLAR